MRKIARKKKQRMLISFNVWTKESDKKKIFDGKLNGKSSKFDHLYFPLNNGRKNLRKLDESILILLHLHPALISSHRRSTIVIINHHHSPPSYAVRIGIGLGNGTGTRTRTVINH